MEISLGNLSWESLLANYLGKFSWEISLGNISLKFMFEVSLGNPVFLLQISLGICSWNMSWTSLLGNISWKSLLGICPGNLSWGIYLGKLSWKYILRKSLKKSLGENTTGIPTIIFSRDERYDLPTTKKRHDRHRAHARTTEPKRFPGPGGVLARTLSTQHPTK